MHENWHEHSPWVTWQEKCPKIMFFLLCKLPKVKQIPGTLFLSSDPWRMLMPIFMLLSTICNIIQPAKDVCIALGINWLWHYGQRQHLNPQLEGTRKLIYRRQNSGTNSQELTILNIKLTCVVVLLPLTRTKNSDTSSSLAMKRLSYIGSSALCIKMHHKNTQ